MIIKLSQLKLSLTKTELGNIYSISYYFEPSSNLGEEKYWRSQNLIINDLDFEFIMSNGSGLIC